MSDGAAEKKMKKVAVLGSGLIGRSFAMLFASGGYRVEMYDLDPEQVVKAKADIEEQLALLEKQGLLRGALTRGEQFDLITGVTDLTKCVEGAFFVQVRHSVSGCLFPCFSGKSAAEGQEISKPAAAAAAVVTFAATAAVVAFAATAAAATTAATTAVAASTCVAVAATAIVATAATATAAVCYCCCHCCCHCCC